MDWVSMIFSFYPPFNERWWGLDPSEFRDMKEKERIIKEEMHAEESTWTFAIIWPKANNFGQKMMLNMFGLQHLWSPVLALNATNSWGEKKVVCNVKSSSHAFPCTFFPFHPFMCHCSILDSFSLPFRDEETLANAQHKGWEDPVLEAMAAPGKVPEVVDAGAQKLAGDAGGERVFRRTEWRMDWEWEF